MNRARPRDSETDRLLRAALGSGASRGAGDGCLDAATAAAWADGGLDRKARRAAETHAADCARCQALLAALVRTAPAGVPARWWGTRTVKWALPAAAALSAAIVVWAIVPRSRPAERAATPAAASVPATVAQTDAASEPVPPAEPKPPARPSRAEAVKRPPRSTNRLDALEQKPSPAPAANEALKNTKSANAPVESGAVADRTVPAAPAAAPQVAAQSTGALLSKALAGRAPIDIASPDSHVRWRLVPGAAMTVVEQTTDGGVTWEVQQTGGGAFSAGASPSPSVCWLAGPDGRVVVTSDGGATWRSVTFPEHIGLAGVTATDARTATVIAADGRRFTTSDAGQTWAMTRP